MKSYWGREWEKTEIGLPGEMTSICSEIHNKHDLETQCEYLFGCLLCLWESSTDLDSAESRGTTGFH